MGFLILLFVYDAWCCERVEALLKGLKEWLSISQKRAEQGMIVLYLALSLLGCWSTKPLLMGVDSVTFGGIAYLMYTIMHGAPRATRIFARYSISGTIFRLLLQAFIWCIVALNLLLALHHPNNFATTVAQVVYLLFFYATDIHSGGESGRRRKLALAELKKMFGTEWIPKPVLEPK